MTYGYSVYHSNFRDSIGQCTGSHRRLTGSSPGRTAARARQGIGFASLCVLDRFVRLCKPVIKAAMPPFANENQLHFKTFLIFQPNYRKNKRSSQCDYERKSKHSKCSYTCEKQSVPADRRNALFPFFGSSQALMFVKNYESSPAIL